ncbi:hypothetical protein AURDEDRAFT_150579 [Auricularia subglabra TFB-10046 SS5]|nr:hypothetical protein AURDEDRAFT_150579 [Auricularia subglabra TFB-10046 SS5]
MPASFPYPALSSIFDYLDIDSLLLSAMPVNAYWRGQAIDHPTYWRTLTFVGRKDLGRHSRAEQSIELLLIRLARTYSRPINLTLARVDAPIFVLLPPHLSHIRRLVVSSHSAHFDALVHALCAHSAPLLVSLSLLFSSGLSQGNHNVIPRDLFCGHAPALRDVSLSNVDILPNTEPPTCFSGITSFTFHNSDQSTHLPLPSPMHVGHQLRSLRISGYLNFEDPELQRKEAWANVEDLELGYLWNWDVFTLPLANIRRIKVLDFGAAAVAALAHMLGDRITVHFPPLGRGAALDDYDFLVAFKVFGDTTLHERLARMRLVDVSRPEYLSFAIAALLTPVVSDRIVELAVWIDDWNALVGRRYLTTFRALRSLVVFFPVRPEVFRWMPLPTATLACQRLERLTLRARGAVVVEVATITRLATALRDAPLPITLELDGVTCSGSLASSEDLLSGI